MADNSGKEGDISPENYKYGAYERNKEREEENNMRKRTANVVWFSFFYYICHHIYNI